MPFLKWLTLCPEISNIILFLAFILPFWIFLSNWMSLSSLACNDVIETFVMATFSTIRKRVNQCFKSWKLQFLFDLLSSQSSTFDKVNVIKTWNKIALLCEKICILLIHMLCGNFTAVQWWSFLFKYDFQILMTIWRDNHFFRARCRPTATQF